ncbi:unnamed protein product [Musa acuminata subsp. malaccensis]|uniref:(wild Malaysian banana) hypothetical protein n=2 Tax=Musa acuminata TaxID=4641 RepID=A0A804JY97_MUSAM|nr:PREDICTED: transcription factor BIM2 isoform X1 [Musa acuminata subsp. malaccensis]CAG1857354.1 unnamed protein product [Musa acuminata subsp. malaccensis]
MEAAASRSGRGFDDEDDDDQEFAKREGFFFSHKDLTIKADGKGSGTDDLPTTPRSKHSAMEQRRRNKINDRFQILRELIPHSDQKRDKASFLLEVIEYIQFLQEKVQKYESSYPGWNQDNAKLMPWVKVYYRSFWKNAQNNNQTPVDGLSDPSQVIRNGSAPPASVFAGQFDENDIPAAPAMLSNAPNPTQLDMTTGVPYKIMETATGFAIADNMPSQAQPHWLGSSSPADCAVSSEMLNEQEELIIDEGTINASASYSQGLLTSLTQTLQSSGVDLSQANISVQINLGKRATNRRPTATTALSNYKDPDDPASTNQAVGRSMMGITNQESSQAAKRHKADNC